MPKFYTTWTVLPHKPIEKYSENLWSVEAFMANGKTQRRMVLARLQDGSIVVHNAIALEESAMAELDAFGKVSAIVVPNGFHRMDAFIWKQRYPNARVFAPKGSVKRVKDAVAVDADLASIPSDATVRAVHLDGFKDIEGVLEIKSADGVTLVFNDAVMNMKKLGGVPGFMLGPTGRASVPRVMRFFAMKNKRAFREHLERLAETPGLRRIVVGHGRTIIENPGDALKAVAKELG